MNDKINNEFAECKISHLNIRNSLTHSHLSKREIVQEIAAKVASVNAPVLCVYSRKVICSPSLQSAPLH